MNYSFITADSPEELAAALSPVDTRATFLAGPVVLPTGQLAQFFLIPAPIPQHSTAPIQAPISVPINLPVRNNTRRLPVGKKFSELSPEEQKAMRSEAAKRAAAHRKAGKTLAAAGANGSTRR
jgi:hypothetical protein